MKCFFLRRRGRKKSQKSINNNTNGTHAGLQFVVHPQPVDFNEVNYASTRNEGDTFSRSSATTYQRKLSLSSDEYKSGEAEKETTIKSNGTETTEKRSKENKKQKRYRRKIKINLWKEQLQQIDLSLTL